MRFKDFFKKYKGRDKKGFTVIEVLAVVVILSITSTATITVFLAVRNTVADTSNVTTEQFNVSQVEKFIRNELQVASKVDIYNKSALGDFSEYPSSGTPVKDDECMVYDPVNDCVYFNKFDGSNWKIRLTLTSVEEVKIHITPVNYKEAQDYQAAESAGTSAVNNTKGTNLKLFYEINGTSFTYNGGMVLGNTKAGQDGNMTWYSDASKPPYCAELVWNKTDSAGTNGLCLNFHSESAEETSSATTSP